MAENHGGEFYSATATGAGGRVRLHGAKHTFMASGETSSGSGAATIDIQVTNIDNPDFDATSGDEDGYWVTAGTITLTLGTTITADGFVLDAPWKYARAHVTAISGTDAAVKVYKGVER